MRDAVLNQVETRDVVHGMNTGDETAIFSFNVAPSAYVFTVTLPDGSVVRHVTIEDGVAGRGHHTLARE